MSDIFDDSFKVSKYIEERHGKILHMDNDLTDNKLAEAIKWAVDSNRSIILPTDFLPDLEDQWNAFNMMPKMSRRMSDWKSIELFGRTNQDSYELYRNQILKNDTYTSTNDIFDYDDDEDSPIPLVESGVDMYYADTYYNSEISNYTTDDVEKAKSWAEESNRVIITPTRTLEELETLWDAYNMMILKHRRESNWMSLEIFGVTNLRHYEYLKSQFLKQDLEKDDNLFSSLVESVTTPDTKKYFESLKNEPMAVMTSSLIETARVSNGIYEDTIIGNAISDVIDSYDSELIVSNPEDICCGDMPYFDPEAMIDMGVFSSNPEDNYYGELSDNTMLDNTLSVKEWFNLYKFSSKGFYTEFFDRSAAWVDKVRSLTFEMAKIAESGDIKALNARKQAILELGWNPEVEFSNKARVIATETAMEKIRSMTPVTKVVDLRKFYATAPSSIREGVAMSNMNPVYVCLVEGKSYISKAIKTITKDIYSHAAISLDTSMHNMYSFGITKTKDGGQSGFRREDISDIPIGGRLRVYAFFVSDSVYKKISDFIENLKYNIDKTSYSVINLITYLFNIPYNREWSMICSQFVDKCLKAGDIDLLGKDSSTVSPSDLNKALKEERRIYTLYQGLASKYDQSKINNLVNALIKRAKPLKENTIYEEESKYISDILINMGNVPVLLEMQNQISIVKNKTIKNILENVVFDSINIKPYEPEPVTSPKLSMLFIESLIEKNIESI